MKPILTLLATLLLAPLATLPAATINLAEPLDYQVIQRTSPATGTVRLRGTLTDLDANGATWEVRIVANGKPGDWQRIAANISPVKSNFIAPQGLRNAFIKRNVELLIATASPAFWQKQCLPGWRTRRKQQPNELGGKATLRHPRSIRNQFFSK